MIEGDQQVNIHAAVSAQQLLPHHSKNDLQRQVLENQKTILTLLNRQQRTNSNDSRKSRS